MRTKTLALLIVGVLLFAGGFLGHDALEGHASAKGPWTVAYAKADCANAPECSGKTIDGDAAGDQGVLGNLIARLDKDGCAIQSIAPYGSAWFVVISRC